VNKQTFGRQINLYNGQYRTNDTQYKHEWCVTDNLVSVCDHSHHSPQVPLTANNFMPS